MFYNSPFRRSYSRYGRSSFRSPFRSRYKSYYSPPLRKNKKRRSVRKKSFLQKLLSW